MCKYPEIEVQLTGEDGNVFAIMGRVTAAMRRRGVPEEIRKEFFDACTNAEDYDEVLRICMNYVNVL